MLFRSRAESARLRAAIDDLFFLTRADAGEPVVRPAAMQLRDVVDVAVRAAQSRAAGRAITVAPDSAVDAPVQGDRELLRRVVDNLLDNAIKYSRPGGAIVVGLRRSGDGWHVDVTDAGPGVPSGEIERLFDRFYRGEDARATAESGGAGLGLAIARWIGRAHGGEVSVVASGPEACTFRLALHAGSFPA